MNKTIILDAPIINGKNIIESLTLRKPLAGDLRGVKLMNYAEMDINSMAKVLPRICEPLITEQDVYKLDLIDFLKIAEAMASFLTPKSQSLEPSTEMDNSQTA